MRRNCLNLSEHCTSKYAQIDFILIHIKTQDDWGMKPSHQFSLLLTTDNWIDYILTNRMKPIFTNSPIPNDTEHQCSEYDKKIPDGSAQVITSISKG